MLIAVYPVSCSVRQESYERAKSLLKSHSKEHQQLAEALLRHETLTAEEIGDVIKGKGIMQ